MLSCKNIAEHAGDIYDKQLPLAKRLAVGLHLILCKACRRFITQYRISAELAARVVERKPDKDAVSEIVKKTKNAGT